MSTFGCRKGNAIRGYKQFIQEGKDQPSPWEELRNQVLLGSDIFLEKMKPLMDGKKELSEIPKSQRRGKPESLAYEKHSKSRNDEIIGTYKSGGYTLLQVGDYFDLHYSTVSGIVKNNKSKT